MYKLTTSKIHFHTFPLKRENDNSLFDRRGYSLFRGGFLCARKCIIRVYPKYTYTAVCYPPTFNVKSGCKINAFQKEVVLRRCFFEETACKCAEGKVKN